MTVSTPAVPALIDRRWAWAGVLGAWGLLVAGCVHGYPPCVDLPAHAAQIETLAQLLRHEPSVSAVYTVKVPLGYGLVFWLSLPFALLWNGAVAARLALWVSLLLWPLSVDALARSFGRSRWAALLCLPLAFNVSYWYGLLPLVSALPLVLFALAAAQRWLGTGRRQALVALNLLALATFLSHLVAFAVLVFLVGVLTLCTRPLARSLLRAALGLTLPLGVSLSKVIAMATRAVEPGPWPATEYNLASHFNWFFKTYGPEGHLAAAGPLAVTLLLVGFALARAERPRTPLVLFFSLAALYFATPKTLSGIYLISVRLPVLAAALALLVVEVRTLPGWVRGLLALVTVLSLGETVAFHLRFAKAIDGLSEAIAAMPQGGPGTPPGQHGYLASEGTRILGSKHIYLEHLGQWVTATRGGVGHNFFADAEHHPVRFKDAEVPFDLSLATGDQLRPFTAVLVFGDGPLPPSLAAFHPSWRNARYRWLVR